MKWLRSKIHIRNHEVHGCIYGKLRMSPPIMGIHKFSYCSGFYKDIREFLDERMFTPAASNSNTSGVTWLELFLLFDTTGARTERGEHIRDRSARQRAEARNTLKKKQCRNAGSSNANVKPTLQEELNRFKAITRQIARQEVGGEQAAWFTMEKREQGSGGLGP